MTVWDKLLQVNIDNKERFQKLFSEIVTKVQNKELPLNVGEIEKEDHFIVVEEDRMSSYFVHIVPKQVYDLFTEMQAQAPNQFLGFSLVAGRHNNKDVRVSCFGVECGLLGKSLLKRK